MFRACLDDFAPSLILRIVFLSLIQTEALLCHSGSVRVNAMHKVRKSAEFYKLKVRAITYDVRNSWLKQLEVCPVLVDDF